MSIKKFLLILFPFILLTIISDLYIYNTNNSNNNNNNNNSGNINDNNFIEKKEFPGELKTYEDENLDSITKFRYNSIKPVPPKVNLDTYEIIISGNVENELKYSLKNFIETFNNIKKIHTLNCVEGWSVKILWEGILFSDIIKKCIPKENTKSVIIYSLDGYTTSFKLDYLKKDKDVMLAFNMNGLPLLPERGYPLHLVLPKKWGYKWAKWVHKIEFSTSENFKGFWEKRGYSNTGNLDKHFFDK